MCLLRRRPRPSQPSPEERSQRAVLDILPGESSRYTRRASDRGSRGASRTAAVTDAESSELSVIRVADVSIPTASWSGIDVKLRVCADSWSVAVGHPGTRELCGLSGEGKEFVTSTGAHRQPAAGGQPGRDRCWRDPTRALTLPKVERRCAACRRPPAARQNCHECRCRYSLLSASMRAATIAVHGHHPTSRHVHRRRQAF